MRKRQTRSSYRLLPQVVGSRTDPTPLGLPLPPSLFLSITLSFSPLLWSILFFSFLFLFYLSHLCSFLDSSLSFSRLLLLYFSLFSPFLSQRCRLFFILLFSLSFFLSFSLSLRLSLIYFSLCRSSPDYRLTHGTLS